jgi:site-specific DNA recombinase
MIARQLVIFAEYEREMISQRVRDACHAMNQRGQYPGGTFPFGYLPTKLEPKGWAFMPHPVYSATVTEIVNELLGGESLGVICRWLEESEIPTPRNVVRLYGNEIRAREGRPLKPIPEAHWHPTSLTKMLRSPAIIGEVATTGGPLRDSQRRLNKRTAAKPVSDSQGFAVKRTDPLIPRDKWEQVKAILDHNSDRAGPRVNASPLLHVAYCAWCKSPLYTNSVVTDGKRYRYYVCPNANRGQGCKSRRIDADWLEGEVERIYLSEVGNLPDTKPDITPASDNRTRIMELSEAIGRLEAQAIAIEAMGGNAPQIRATQDVHKRNVKALGKEQPKPAETREVETGETKGQAWARLDSAGRNALLRKDGWHIDAARDGRKAPMVRLVTGYRDFDVDERGQIQPRGYYAPWWSQCRIRLRLPGLRCGGAVGRGRGCCAR